MTYRDSAVAPAATGSSQVQIIVPATAVVGDVLTIAAVRASSSTQTVTISSSNGGTFEQTNGTAGAVSTCGTGATFTTWRREVVSGDAGSTITIASSAGFTARWYAGVHVAYDVGPDDDVTVTSSPSGGSASFVLPAADPTVGSQGGTAVGFALGSINNNAAGLTFSSSDATIRAQATHTGATGQNPAIAVLDREFTDDTQVPTALVTSTPSASSRATVTVLYSGAVVTPLDVDAGPDQSASGGQQITATATATGGTGSLSYAWEIIDGGVGAVLFDEDTDTVRVVVPLAADTIELACTVTDSAVPTPATAVDTLLISVAGRVLVPLEATTLAAGWTTSTGGTNPAAVVDELVDFTDHLLAPSGSGAAQTIPLDTLPASVRDNGFVIYVGVDLDAVAATASLTVELMEGATVRGTEVLTPTTTQQRLPATFTAGECDAIVDLAACSVRLTAVTT